MAASAEQPIAAPRRGEFRAQSEHVEKLAAKLDQAGDPEVRAAALELVQSVVELHGAALQRLIECGPRRQPRRRHVPAAFPPS